jgi:glucose dehydrogenase
LTESLSADVVIVGSGVAGGLIANELVATGLSVIILEAGPRVARWKIVERYRNNAARNDFAAPYPPSALAPHPQYSPANDYLILNGPDAGAYAQQYIRYLGGTTWHWAACAWRQMPNDFKLFSTYGVGRDYAISYTDLEQYYYRAEVALGVSGPQEPRLQSPSQRTNPYPMDALPYGNNDNLFTHFATVAGYLNVPEPVARNSQPYADRPQCCGNNNCMPICPIAAMYSGDVHVVSAEQKGARVVTEAVVYRVEIGAKAQVTAVHYFDAQRQSQRVTGKYFVLAANGIETPRLLLYSADDAHPRGIANRSDQVGRNMMDHPGISMRFLAKDAMWPGRGPIEMSSIVDFRDGDFRREMAGAKFQLNNMSQARNAGLDALAMGLTGSKLDEEIRYRAAHTVEINSLHDTLPNPENRLTLSLEYKDALGIPRPQIYYDVGHYTRRAGARTRDVFKQLAASMGGSEIGITPFFLPNNHIMGGTIMGDDPADSVVDGDCRTHDHSNLFLATGAVMPTAGTANCTLTIAALALRAADRIKADLVHG